MRLYDGMDKPVPLGREIGRGGEGAVLEVTHDAGSVAKVYHSAVERDKRDKLKAMAQVATAELLRVAAWPTATLHETPGGEVVGVLMPRVSGHHEVHQLYSPAQRKVHFPKADWSFLAHVAMNSAAAFETVHASGHVVGDVNQSGVLVSNRGTVRLIDCDSFQIRDNGRIFYCVVGVPQYTPPELQGRAFRGIVRTPDHDCFGLSLLIFHLLFMGRHPFAGRFHGSGDMPIEKAISEGRFAFGKLAQSFQMTPPPHSLPFDALPRPIADMFERSFARPQPGVTRPSASEWRQAMVKLKDALSTCLHDRGHRFSTALSGCPWCHIMRTGGPNFFISVQIAGTGAAAQFTLPRLDVDAIWRRIEAIPRPHFYRPAYPPPLRTATPTPLPEDVLDQLLFLRLTGVVALVTVVIGVVGAIVSLELLKYLGFGLAVPFAAWWALLGTKSKFKRERDRRRGEAREKRAALEIAQRRWDEIAEQCGRRFELLWTQLESIRAHASSIQTRFEDERKSLETDRRKEQLDEFLETQFIRDYRIPQIGRGRMATLLSYGVETAADIDEDHLDDIPGFGPSIVGELIAWRQEVAKRFVFDHRKPAPVGKMQTLLMKYRQQQQTCEARLASGQREMAQITEEARRELDALAGRIQSLVPQVRQAEADASLT